MHLLLTWSQLYSSSMPHSKGKCVPFTLQGQCRKAALDWGCRGFLGGKGLIFVGCKLFPVLVKCCIGQMLCEQAPVYQGGFSEAVDLLKSLIGLPLLFSDGSWINNQAIKAQGWQLFVEYVEKAKQAGRWVGKVGRLLQCLCCCVCCCRDAGRSGQKQVKKASK